MSHYAKVEDPGIVTQVIVAEADHIATLEGTWIKTSYNIHAGVYCEAGTLEVAKDQSVINDDEGRQRKNYAQVGWVYDGTGFHPPRPFPSWTLNSSTYLWEPPVEEPKEGLYEWNEESRSWDELEIIDGIN